MHVRSLGFRTDLALLAAQGSDFEQRDGYLVVRTPANPTFHWGNFILLAEPPPTGAVAGWLDVFAEEFPAADHIAIGIDGTAGDAGDEARWHAAKLKLERSTVLTATEVRPPPRPNTAVECRMLGTDSDPDWAAALEVKLANNTDHGPDRYRTFASRANDAMRRLQAAGHGGWFGAFLDGHLVAGLGIFAAGGGLARFQQVDTHPDHRNRGIAGTLVHAASRYALTELGAHTLVMVADPDYVAVRVYRSVGFTDTETQVQLEGSR